MTEQNGAPAIGAALDAEIGRVVFGITKLHYPYGNPAYPYYIPSGKPWRTHHIDAVPLPAFSTDWAAMGRLVAALRARGYRIELGYTPAAWCDLTFGALPPGQLAEGYGETLPEALARAALAALGGKGE